jgi:Tol biopolymer transport system component
LHHRFALIRGAVVVLLLAGCASDLSAPTLELPTVPSDLATSTAPLPTPTLLPKPAPTSPPPLGGSGGGVITFASNRSGNNDLFVMNAEGSDQRPLTATEAQDGWANWSPDGRRIAFQSDRSSALNVYVMDVAYGMLADERAVRRLINSPPGRGSWEPAWSPDRMWIACSSEQAAGSDMYLVRPDGTTLGTGWHADRVLLKPGWEPRGLHDEP